MLSRGWREFGKEFLFAILFIDLYKTYSSDTLASRLQALASIAPYIRRIHICAPKSGAYLPEESNINGILDFSRFENPLVVHNESDIPSIKLYSTLLQHYSQSLRYLHIQHDFISELSKKRPPLESLFICQRESRIQLALPHLRSLRLHLSSEPSETEEWDLPNLQYLAISFNGPISSLVKVLKLMPSSITALDLSDCTAIEDEDFGDIFDLFPNLHTFSFMPARTSEREGRFRRSYPTVRNVGVVGCRRRCWSIDRLLNRKIFPSIESIQISALPIDFHRFIKNRYPELASQIRFEMRGILWSVWSVW
jgi:hypothetical protein